jgi:hypothetical protein
MYDMFYTRWLKTGRICGFKIMMMMMMIMIKDLSHNIKQFKAALKDFLYWHSFYTWTSILITGRADFIMIFLLLCIPSDTRSEGIVRLRTKGHGVFFLFDQ